MLDTIIFYLLAATAVISAFFVVRTKQPTNGVLALVVTMFSIAALFITLQAHFVAMIHILIYAGAILVLFLFIIMLLGTEGAPSEDLDLKGKLWRIFGITIIVVFSVQLALIIKTAGSWELFSSEIIGSVESIGRSLFGRNLLAFELVSLILLVGVVGVVNLSKKDDMSRHA